jgi:hypothetical protein
MPAAQPKFVAEDDLGGLTVSNTAHVLDCSERHVERLIALNRLKTFNVGTGGRRGKRITRESIANLINGKNK